MNAIKTTQQTLLLVCLMLVPSMGLAERIKDGLPVPSPPEPEKGPGIDSSLREILDYWRNNWIWRDGATPTPEIRERLLQAVKKL